MKPTRKIRAIMMGVLLITFSGTCFLKAQEASPAQNNSLAYVNGIGLRFGTDAGISYKHFIKSNTAIEGILGADYRGFVLEGLYEKQMNLFKPSGLGFFYGAGAYVGLFQQQRMVYFYNDRWGYYYTNSGYPSLGIEGIVGLEYKIPKIPFTTGIDLKPVIGIYYPGYSFLEGALTVRYIFGRVNNSNAGVPR